MIKKFIPLLLALVVGTLIIILIITHGDQLKEDQKSNSDQFSQFAMEVKDDIEKKLAGKKYDSGIQYGSIRSKIATYEKDSIIEPKVASDLRGTADIVYTNILLDTLANFMVFNKQNSGLNEIYTQLKNLNHVSGIYSFRINKQAVIPLTREKIDDFFNSYNRVLYHIRKANKQFETDTYNLRGHNDFANLQIEIEAHELLKFNTALKTEIQETIKTYSDFKGVNDTYIRLEKTVPITASISYPLERYCTGLKTGRIFRGYLGRFRELKERKIIKK